MVKVVFNGCYGGFSLSHEAILRYAEIKGLTLYPEENRYGMTTYWTASPEERKGIVSDEEFRSLPMEERQAANEAYSAQTICCRDLSRTDPVLVQVVEELGDKANGRCARLAIAEVPKGSSYRIDEYDGFESVMTIDDYSWEVAK